MEGIQNVEITVGEKPFKVTFDTTKVDTKSILAALAAKNEPAKLCQ
ncbi:MAG TPA: hypothetical protein PKE00_12690 [Planctomycetota bacterium]|nr:hypothetical protein [Planctomycetota bacterium]